MKRVTHKSRIFEAVYETAKDMNKLGFIDMRAMRRYDAMCVEPVPTYSAEQIRALRNRYRISQAVLATILNTSLSTIRKWEIGEKHPGGPSLKLLYILDRKGIKVFV